MELAHVVKRQLLTALAVQTFTTFMEVLSRKMRSRTALKTTKRSSCKVSLSKYTKVIPDKVNGNKWANFSIRSSRSLESNEYIPNFIVDYFS